MSHTHTNATSKKWGVCWLLGGLVWVLAARMCSRFSEHMLARWMAWPVHAVQQGSTCRTSEMVNQPTFVLWTSMKHDIVGDCYSLYCSPLPLCLFVFCPMWSLLPGPDEHIQYEYAESNRRLFTWNNENAILIILFCLWFAFTFWLHYRTDMSSYFSR